MSDELRESFRKRHAELVERNNRGPSSVALMPGQLREWPELKARVDALLAQAGTLIHSDNLDAMAIDALLDHVIGMLAAPHQDHFDFGPHSTLPRERMLAQQAGFAQGKQLIHDTSHEQQNRIVKAHDAAQALVEGQRARDLCAHKLRNLLRQVELMRANDHNFDRNILSEWCRQMLAEEDRHAA
jgi:hypothetical protein